MLRFIKAIFSFIKNIFLIAILLFLVVFMVSNREIAVITFSPLDFFIETRMFIIMIGFFFAGFIFAFLLFLKNRKKSFLNSKNISKNKVKSTIKVRKKF